MSGDGNKCQEHIACSYAYQIVCSVLGIEFEPRLYVGVDAADHFLNTLQEDLNKYIMPLIEKDVDMIWNDEAKEKFESATHCHVCKKPLGVDKVKDHCHFTGKFRGAANSQCNLNYKITKKRYRLPIVFHNLCGYDAHLIFQKIKRKHDKINVIPNNSERYISFHVGGLKFLDSMQFLSHGLDKFAEQLSNDQFKHLKAAYPEHWELLSKKGIYCYRMNSMERFLETSLLSKEHFFSKLYDKACIKGAV